MTAPARSSSPARVRMSHVEWVSERMTERDFSILETVNRLRLVSSRQIERLYFSTLSTTGSRNAARGRTLRRLISWRVLTPLPRRIGGMGHGSAVQVIALDSTGRRLLAARQAAAADEPQLRAVAPPGERTVRHTLAVAELYTELSEQTRNIPARLTAFITEPACWWPNGLGGYVKPDAFLTLEIQKIRYYWWIELDLATETLATVRRKALTYLDFVRRGQLGPRGVIPRILISVPDTLRAGRIAQIIHALPSPAGELLTVTEHGQAATMLLKAHRESDDIS